MSSQERTKGSLIKKQGRHLQAITCEPRRKLCKQVSVWPTFFVKICFSTLLYSNAFWWKQVTLIYTFKFRIKQVKVRYDVHARNKNGRSCHYFPRLGLKTRIKSAPQKINKVHAHPRSLSLSLSFTEKKKGRHSNYMLLTQQQWVCVTDIFFLFDVLRSTRKKKGGNEVVLLFYTLRDLISWLEL